MRESRFYLVGGAVGFVGLGALVLLGPSWPAAAVLLLGLATVMVGAWLRGRRSSSLQVAIEDEHLHPIPVLDEPKGTYDLIAGMAVRVDNRQDEPVGVRIDTVLYERTALKWDRPVSGARTVELLAPSVVPGRAVKSFFVRNYTRIPPDVDVLTPSHFIKLLIETSSYGKSLDRIFLAERFELPKETPQPAASTGTAAERAPLLPFSDLGQAVARRPSPAGRFSALLRRLRPHAAGTPDGEMKIHRLRRTEDSLEGLIDEINAEIDAEIDDEIDDGLKSGG